MSSIFAFINFSDLDDNDFDYGNAKIPVPTVLAGVFNKTDEYDSGIGTLLANNNEFAKLGCYQTIGAWVTFAWNRENEYLIAKINNRNNTFLTMHRVTNNYAFTITYGLAPIIAFLDIHPATIAFTARHIKDPPRILSSRRLLAGAITMQKTIDDMANGKDIAKLIPNYLKPELSRYLGKLYTLGELSNSNKMIESIINLHPPTPNKKLWSLRSKIHPTPYPAEVQGGKAPVRGHGAKSPTL
jgi:hypothetical protein